MFSTPNGQKVYLPVVEGLPRVRRSQISFARLWSLATSKGAMTLMDQVIYSAGNFLTAIILARTFAAHEFGLYFLGMRLADYLREVANVLIWSPYMFLSPRLQGEAHARYTGSTLIHQLSLSVIGGGLFVLAALGWRFVQTPTVFSGALLPLACVAAWLSFQEYTRRHCFANFQTMKVLLLDSLVTLLQVGGLLALAFTHTLSLSRAYWVIAAANGGAALCWLIGARHEFALARGQVMADFRHSFTLGKWLLGGNLALLAGNQFFPWTLSFFHGAAATGVYAAGEGVTNFIRALMISVQNYLGPRLAHAWAQGGVAELRQVVRQTTLFLSAVTGVLSFIAMVGGGFFVRWLYGAQYDGLQLLVALLAANIFVCALMTSQSYALSVMKRPAVNFQINLVGLVVTLLLGWLLVKHLGVTGAAGGLLCATSVTAVLRHFAFKRQVKQEMEAAA